VVDGSATVWALANDVAGSYVVTASVQQVAPAYVHLTQQVPVDGLSAESSSPTYLSHFTGFTASVTAGTDVSYTWDFGDGSSGAGQTVEHRYNDSGHFTATVTAHNAISEQSTQVWVNVATQGDLSGKLQTQLAQDNIRYSFVVSNAIVLSRFRTQQSDPYLLSNVVLTGSVPANTTLVDWSANVITSTTGGSYGNGYVQLSVPTQLAPGENVTITWLVHPQSMSGDIQTDAKATSDTGVAQPTVLAETYLWRSLLPLVFR